MTTAVLNGHGYKARRGSPIPVDSKTAPRGGSDLSLKNSESDINLKSVRKVDSHVASLLMTVPQVAIYKYLEDTNNWERTLIEGTLFVYSRSISPSHGFVLLNRLSSDNLLQLISPNLPIHTQTPFVLFKRNDVIYGLCFNDETTCGEVGLLLSSLSQLDSTTTLAPTRASSAPSPSPPSSSSSSSSSGVPHQKSLDSLSERDTNSDRLTPSPNGDITHNGRNTSSPQTRKDQGRKLRSSTSRRSSEPVTMLVEKKTTSSTITTSAKSSRSRSRQQRVSPQPGQLPGNSHSQKPVTIEKSKSAYSPAVRPSSNNITSSPTLARKLFSDSVSADQTSNKTMMNTVPALRDLFAQAASKPAPDLVSLDTARPTLKKAVSLAEVEKQIMEVPSPTTTQPQKAHSCDASSTVEQSHVLLQPAVFSSSNTVPLTSEPAAGTIRPTVHMTVQPPTPVGPPPSSSLTAEPRLPAVFPTVPPLVHSPGMRAAPLSTTKHSTAFTARQRQSSVEQTDSPNLSAKLSPILSKRVTQDSANGELRPQMNGHQSPQLVNNHQVPDPPQSTSTSSLMSPGMFQPRSNTDPLPSTSSSTSSVPVPPAQGRSSSPVMVAGLTRCQLQQALLHLIQTDDKFVDTLHMAYVDSLRVNRTSSS